MCEMMGTQPTEEEMPVELDDLHDEVQEAFSVYNMLTDIWDSMGGSYIGKQMAGISDIMDIMGVEDKRVCLYILSIIDRTRSKLINSKKKPSK